MENKNTTETDVAILYEDGDYLVVSKPAGLVVHSDGKTVEPSLCDWLLARYPDMKEVGEPLTMTDGKVIYRPGIVHRLDRETSGALVVAKNQPAFLLIKQQFLDREVEKKYHAFAFGIIREEQGVIDRPIGRSKNDFRKWTAERGARGELREAVTAYRVLARSEAESSGVAGGVTFLEAEPKTGRTHQIRVHLKAISHPLVADSLYAPQKGTVLGFERLALHSRHLSFRGAKGEKISVEAPYPADFERAIAEIGA